MSCRCSEISRCDREIALISGEIAQRLNNAQSNNDSMMAKFPAVSNSLSDTIFIGNLEKVSQRAAAIKKQHDGLLNNLQSRRSGELTRIRNRRSSFESADRRYHEMMEQRVRR